MLTQECRQYTDLILDSEDPCTDLLLFYDIAKEQEQENGILLSCYYALEWIVIHNRKPYFVGGKVLAYSWTKYNMYSTNLFELYPESVPPLSKMFIEHLQCFAYYPTEKEAYYALVFALVCSPYTSPS